MSNTDLHKGADSKLFGFARENRKNQTNAESLLWSNLRGRKLKGFKFRRQHPLKNFIADFYCYEMKLAIELDGGYHNKSDQKEYDQERIYELGEVGIKVLRFKNEEIENDILSVLEKIEKVLRSLSD